MWKNIFELLKRYKYQSVLVKTFFIVIGIEIAMMAIVNSIYIYKIEKNIYREIEESCVLEVERQSTILDALVEQIINFSYFTTAQESMAVFGQAFVGSETKEKQTERLYACSKTFQKSFDYIESVYIYLEDQDCVITDNSVVELSEINDTGWLEGYEQFKNEPFYTLKSRIQNGTYPYLLTVYYPVYRVPRDRRGAVIVNINMDKLSETLGFAFRDLRNIYMISSEGEILVTNQTKALKNPDLIDEELRNMWKKEQQQYPLFIVQENAIGEKAIVAVKSGYGNWYYWMEFSMEYYGRRFEDTRQFMLWGAMGSIFVGLIVSVAVALKSYQPIRYAMGLLESNENVVEDILKDENNRNEIRRIFELTHQFPREGVGGEVQSNEWLERLGRSQMQVLQSQITPHFLYNTLDSIRWMAVEWRGEQNEVSQAVHSLSQLLRKSLNQTSYFVTLSEEVEQAKLYIQVMEIQDPGKLEVAWEVPEELSALKMVRFTIQPILENAIKHGFKHRRHRGKIKVKAELIAENLMIIVKDDGCGMTVEDCVRMNQRLASEYDIVNEHVGIQNVNQRIKIMFGEEYGVRLMPGDEEGLMVYLVFPIMDS